MEKITVEKEFKQIVTHTISSVYGQDFSEMPKLADSYVYTGEFRPPSAGETFLSTFRTIEYAVNDFDGSRPRLIVRKKKPQPKRYTGIMATLVSVGDMYNRSLGEIERDANNDGYEIFDFRKAQMGEYVCARTDGRVLKATEGTGVPVLICRKVE